jgi:hypothetical protein
VREQANAERIRGFMREAGASAAVEGVCYLAGGATSVLLGWRASTLDVDIRLDPEQDALLAALPGIKDRVAINVELASPADFIPLPAGWEDRSEPAAREGRLKFRHFDLYSQALAKLERGHARDVVDVEEMLARGLVDGSALRAKFDEIEPELYRFPAIDPAAFRRAVEEQTS